MSFNFDIQLSGLPDDGKKNLDLYFQPALTWMDAAANKQVQGIAMLFLQNDASPIDPTDPNSLSNPEAQDFREMVKILVRWIWAAYHGSETFSPTKEGLQEVYDAFVQQPLADTELNTFLKNHFVFCMQEYIPTSDLAATVFPMFPHLSLQIGTDPYDTYETYQDRILELAETPITITEAALNEFEQTLTPDITDPDELVRFQSLIEAIKLLDLETQLFATLTALDDAITRGIATASFTPASNSDKILDAAKITQLQTFNKQFKPNFAPADGGADTILTNNLPAFIFVGYFRLLVRSGLQQLIDATPQSTIEDMLEAVTDDEYDNLAGMASTFLFNGYRVPPDIFSIGSPAQGLYEATGQQFPFEDAKQTIPAVMSAPDEDGNVTVLTPAREFYTISLKSINNTGGDLPVLQTSLGAAFVEITYQIDDPATTLPTQKMLSLAQGLENDVEITDFTISKPLQIDLHKTQHLYFALRQVIDWQKTVGDTDQLLPLPTSLRIHTRQDGPTVDLRSWLGGQHQNESILANNDFSWVSMIKFTVRRIIDSETQEFLPHTYELVEGSDDDLNRLEEVFNFLVGKDVNTNHFDLHLAYSPGGSSTTADLRNLEPATDVNGITPDTIIFCTNLSSNTDSPLAAPYFASQKSDPNVAETDFLQMVWQGCTMASGGYFLNLQHEDSQVNTDWFAGADTAELHLIIEFMAGDDPIHPFHNAALVFNPVDLETDLLLARSSETIPVLIIPPGHVGITMTRSIPAESEDALAQAQNFYHMLGFGLGSSTDFVDALSGMPIGPTLLGDPATTTDWQYERLIPAFSFWANPPATTNTKLPPLEQDPYLGITGAASLPVECWWQDIYGNALTSRKGSEDFPLRYTDPVIGLNQWPSVQEHFHFDVGLGSDVTLTLEFSFDPSPYPAADAAGNKTAQQQKRLSADLLLYQKIYYQFIQTDIELSVANTIDANWVIDTAAIDKSLLLGFVEAIYVYLADVDAGIVSAPPVPLSIPFSRPISSIVLPTAFIFPIEVSFTISRLEARLHDDLKNSPGGNTLTEHLGVLQDTARLSPKITEAFSARDFAADFETAFPDLRLAVGDDRLKKKAGTDVGRPYYAVQLGTANGVSYNILEENPAYFALPPLANTLLTDTVVVDNYTLWKGDPETDHAEEKQFEAIDLNVLARDFLVALEAFLEPKSLAAARQLDIDGSTNLSEAILTSKANLATSISETLDAVLVIDQGTGNLAEAKASLKRELLEHLVQGYDIETAVQFQVEITVGDVSLTSGLIAGQPSPRIRGMAVVKNVWLGEDPTQLILANKEDLDFSLSTGAINLVKAAGTPPTTASSTFTYLFDTKTPEKFAAIHLELEFRVTEIEYEIEAVPGITEFQASNWLSLVLPENLNTYQITSQVITDAETTVSDRKNELTLFSQVIQKLETSTEKDTEFSTDVELQAAIEAELRAAEYSQFEDLFKAYSLPTFGITQVGMDRVFAQVDLDIAEQTTLLTVIQSIRDAQPPLAGTEFSTMADFTAALEAIIGNNAAEATASARVHAQVLPFYRIADELLDELDTLLNNGQAADLQAVRDTLDASTIRTLEFLSLSGFQTGLRKELGEATYTTFKNRLEDASSLTYRLDVAALDLLEEQANVTLTNLSLFKIILLESKNGGLFEIEFFSQLEFEAALRRELGRLSYEKYKAQILQDSQPFYQMNTSRLDRLQNEYTGALPTELRAMIRTLKACKHLNSKFATELDFNTALLEVIEQTAIDSFSADLQAYANPYRVTDNMIAGLESETGLSEPAWYERLVQDIRSDRLKDREFILETDFEQALIESLGGRFFGRFRTQIQTFNQLPYRMAGATLDGLNQQLADDQALNDQAALIITSIQGSALDDQLFFSLLELEDAVKSFLGESSYTEFDTVLQGYTREVYRMSHARLQTLRQQLRADSAALLLYEASLSLFQAPHPPFREYLSSTALEEALKQYLELTPYENFSVQSSLATTRLSQGVYRFSEAMLKRISTVGDANLFDQALLDGLQDQEFLSYDDFSDAVKAAIGTDNFDDLLEPELIAADQAALVLTDSILDDLLAEVDVQLQDLTELGVVLTTLDTPPLKTDEFTRLEGLEENGVVVEGGLATAIETQLGPTDYAKFEEQILAAVQPFFRMEGDMLTSLQTDHSADLTQLTDFQSLLVNIRGLNVNVLDTTHASLANLDQAFIDESLTHYDTYKHQLLDLADDTFQITTVALDALDQSLTDQKSELGTYGSALQHLQNLPANSHRDEEFASLEALETALRTEVDTIIDYDTYRGQLLKYALPIYRIDGGMLSTLQQQHEDDLAVWASFQGDLQDLRSLDLAEERTYNTQEELTSAFREALSTTNFSLQEQQQGLLQATLLAFTNPVFRLGDQWLADQQVDLDTRKTALEELGAALNHLHESDFGDREFSSVEDVDTGSEIIIGIETGISDELELVAAGTYALFENDLTSLIEPVHELFIPADLDPSGTLQAADEDEFTAIRQILEDSDLPGVDFATRLDLEAAIKKVIGDPDFQLFQNVAPLFTNPNYMGKSPVPIPLRDYPTPPALIYQGAEVDESSRTDLEDIRQWEYTIIYEHEDIAQDSIDCIIELNTLDPNALAVASSSGTPTRDLFQALVNFNEVYPKLAKDLALLRNDQLFDLGQEANHALATQALQFFQMLAAEVDTAWGAWTPVVTVQQATGGDLHFEISEEPFGTDTGINGETLERKQGFIYPRPDASILTSLLGGDLPEPLLALPGYQQEGDPVWAKDPDRKIYTFLEDPLDETFFGDSSIPDRKFTVENLDVIEHQNALASVWLSRNKILIAGLETNPKFIFQTPAVSFTNRVSPFITNDEPWDLATLHSPDNQAQDKPLLEHMELMLRLIAPDTSALAIDYEVRLSCRYAFSLAMGTGLNVDLKSTLPILMGLRLSPSATTTAGDSLLAAYPKMLTDEIKLWLRQNDPSHQNASLLFSVNLFSKLDPNSLTSLPMLRIKHLELKLENFLKKKPTI